MKKKYVTTMKDQVGAFLRASKIISSAGGNIVRVSYNKSVDVNTLFLDVSGTKEQIDIITDALKINGYIAKEDTTTKVLLLELRLEDKPGTIIPILELINNYNFNISYMNSIENATPHQNFKMGIYIENTEAVSDFLSHLSKLCEVKIIDYDNTEKYLDNTVFYMSFANKVADKLHLDNDLRHKLIVYSNMIMQQLDNQNKPAYKTFEYIGKFADSIAKYKGTNFTCKLYNIALKNDAIMYVVEPACGSNTYVIQKGDKLLFVDTGFACYGVEMNKILEIMIPNYYSLEKELIITHADIDHCGLMDMFPKVYVTKTSYENFVNENNNEPNIRECKLEHLPYCKISRILTGYKPPRLNNLVVIGGRDISSKAGLEYICELELLGEKFQIYEGNGGHTKGEVVIVCDSLELMFTGDIMVNIKGFSKEQYDFNLLAPYLMSSVNLDSRLATIERKELIRKFDLTKYNVCCGHGAVIPKGEYI